MKTPMSAEIIADWSLPAPPLHSLTVPSLLASQRAQGREVGLIIDLANHDCLYIDDVPPEVEYAHVQLVAKVLPPHEAIDEVEAVAKEFWGRQPDKYIAIHCAYGFNRTGFVVGSYLCQACGLSVDEALESFATARPPGVKHEKFVNELYRRYGHGAPARKTSRNGEKSGPPASLECAVTMHTLGGTTSAASSATRLAEGQGDDASNGQQRHHEQDPEQQQHSHIEWGAAAVSGAGREDGRRGSDTPGSAHASQLAPSAPPEVESGEEREAGRGDYSGCAAQLEGKSAMRRQTSLGLAKALHRDFGHDHDNSSPAPEDPSTQTHLNGGSVTPRGIPRPPATGNLVATSPNSPPPLTQRLSPGTDGNPFPAFSLQKRSSTMITDTVQQPVGTTGRKPSILRSPSGESDNHSLGFGPLEALGVINLRTSATVGMARTDTRSELDGVDLDDWMGPPEAGEAGHGRKEKGRGRPQGQHPGRCKMM